MWIALFALVTRADTTSASEYGGLAADAPAAIASDATVPILARDTAEVLASLGDVPLEVVTLVTTTSWNTPILGIRAPDGGWPVGPFEITVDPDDEDPSPLALTAGSEPAAPPTDPVIVEVGATDWAPDGETPVGCCFPTRLVAITVESSDPDPWSFVQIRGVVEGASPIAEDLEAGLDGRFGPGAHLLTYTQWDDDGVLQPACFDVVGMSASGAESAPQQVCPAIDLVGTESDPGDKPVGCAAVPTSPGLFAIGLAALLAAGRGRRSTRGTTCHARIRDRR